MEKEKKEVVSLTKDEIKLILEILDYSLDNEEVILDQKGEKIICPFTKEEIKLSEVSIMPGSLIIMKTTPVTLSEYFYQYPDD